MNANLVNILTWAKPAKTTAALISVNVVLWFLIRQRPFCVIPLAALVYYLKYLWKHRIRSEVLVDPPDDEDWITLSAYDFEHVTCSLGKSLWKSWVNLRQEHHLLWAVGTCTIWVLLAKIGIDLDFLTLLFIISNGAFVIFPLLKFFPKIELAPAIETEDLIPDVPKASEKKSRRRRDSSPSFEDPVGLIAVPVSTQQQQEPSSSSSLYEGILTRSMAAAAASIVSSASTSVFSSGIMGSQSSSLYPFLPAVAESMTALVSVSQSQLTSSGGPESLTPAVSVMPDHEVVDSDPEDEFLFDAKHFDKSSSSSSFSNSFEIIDDDL